jgi:hypothetical protein
MERRPQRRSSRYGPRGDGPAECGEQDRREVMTAALREKFARWTGESCGAQDRAALP